MTDFAPSSRIRDVVAAGPAARELLHRHGYELGEGFVDALSQYQTLDDANREGRLRDLETLIRALNEGDQK